MADRGRVSALDRARAIALACLAFAAADAAAVDTILHNGKVWTGDPGQPAVTAIAIDAGRIVATGTDAAILELASKDSQRIDLKGRRVAVNAKGTATNLLEVDHKRDSSRVAFLVNGQEVYATDASAMNLDGIVGIRTNHNLDLHIEGFDVHR